MKRSNFALMNLICLSVLASCGSTNEQSLETKSEEIKSEVIKSEIEKSEEVKEEVKSEYSIHTEKQNKYLQGNYALFTAYAKGKEDLCDPVPVNLSLKDTDKLFVSETTSFEAYTEFKGNDDIYNLKINTTYYYKVNDLSADILSFDIIDTKWRNLKVEGITNVRDIGGYATNDNKHVKQGMIFRSSCFNKDESTELNITENGIKTMKDDLKVKSELDLRLVDNNQNGGITTSPLGEDVNYYSIPMQSSGNVLGLNKDLLKDVFDLLKVESNYPFDVHCSIGRDRTGMVCFVINALLGVSDDDLYFEYLFSNFANFGGMKTASVLTGYFDTIKSCEGSTTSEKMYNYLLSVGVSKEALDSTIAIMKE